MWWEHCALHDGHATEIVASGQQEIGCVGIDQVDPHFFEDVAYALIQRPSYTRIDLELAPIWHCWQTP